ncbi:hypothetical protein [Hymenobacter roseosalivarius]|nr:hypothetical protein [Hymenobacter roseosalivarius]
MQTLTLRLPRRFALLLRVAGFFLALVVLTPTKAHAQTWLVSTDAYIKLGVMDKFSQLGTYTATFVVTDQTSGREYWLTREVEKGKNGVDVLFPSEPSEPDYFKTAKGEAARATPGKYAWECRVSGKRVVGGRFELPAVANDVTVVDNRK